MKLQKQLSRKVGDKKYEKWVIVLPPKKIAELGWGEGQELDVLSEDNSMKIKAKKKKKG
jgi:hypothetical protein